MLNNLNALAADIHQANKDKGFWNTYYTLQETPPAERPAYQEDVVNALRVRYLALAAGELSEGIEAIRKGRNTNPADLEAVQQKADAGEEWKIFFGIKVKDTEEDEIADAIIRLLDYAGARGIDLEKHIELKLAYNSSRPYLHGKTFQWMDPNDRKNRYIAWLHQDIERLKKEIKALEKEIKLRERKLELL